MRMNRQDILESAEDLSADGQQENLSEAINYIEYKFNEIRDLLETIDINKMDNIVAAKRVADELSDDLYNN